VRALLVLVVALTSGTASAQVFPLPDQGPPPTPEPLYPPPPSVFFSLAVGTAAGVVGGDTQGLEVPVKTGPQWSPMHLRAELGAFRGTRYAVAIAGRLGFPFTVDIGDPPTAKSVMLRVYRFMGPWRFNVAAGAGYVRYVVGVDGTSKDVMAAGPALAGGGAGYVLRLSKSWRFTVDANLIAAIKTSESYNGIANHHALHFDLDVGFAVYR
jgi:hypothetical protein